MKYLNFHVSYLTCFLLHQYFENRPKYLPSQKEGHNPYPHKFSVSMSILEYIKNYGSLSNEEHQDNVTVSLAGMKILKIYFFKEGVNYIVHSRLLILSFFPSSMAEL